MMSRSNSNTNNSAPFTAREYGSYHINPYDSNHAPLGSQSIRANMNSRGSLDEQRSFGRRSSSFGSPSFPSQYHPHPVPIIIFEPQLPRESNPPWQRRVQPTRPIENRLTEERLYPRSSEQRNKAAVENLSKEFYNPGTKRITNSINLYYRDTPVNPRDIANQEDGKRCSICLEDFERGDEVMVTPCKHMFHEDCIVPWAKTNAQCPVCRFVFGPKTSESSSALPFNNSSFNRGRAANMVGHGLTTQEFLSIITALGDSGVWS